MNAYKQQELDWAKGYYSQIVGFTIIDVIVHKEENEIWTSLICEKTTADGATEKFALEISQDPEGNGPGFLFGLPSFIVK